MLIAVAGVLIAAVYLESILTKQQHQEHELEVRSRLSEIGARLESTLSSNIVSVRGLAAYLAVNPALSDSDFKQISQLFLQNNPLINNVGVSDQQYNMVRVYPEENNRAILGGNLLDIPSQAVSAREAMQSGRVQFSGPVQLLQGGQAFIVRIPIVNPISSDIAGLLSFPISLNSLYDRVGILQLSRDYLVSIRSTYEFSTGQVFFGKEAVFDQKHVLQDVDLPSARWQIAAVPLNQFHGPLMARIWIYCLAGFLIVIILIVQWLRFKELRSLTLIEKQQMMLDQAQRVGQIGSWSWHIPVNDIFWSDEAYRLFGLDKSDPYLKDKGYLDFVYQEDLDTVRQQTKQAMNQGGRYQMDFRIVRPDGEMRWVHSEGVVDLTVLKKPLRVFGTFQDVTASKRIERQLIQSESELRAVTDAAQSLIMIIRIHDGLVRFSNPSSQRLLGIDPDSLVGLSIVDFFVQSGSYSDLVQSAEQSDYVRDRKLTLYRADNNHEVSFLLGVQKINYEGDICFVADLVDISSMLEAQAALEDSEERFRLFAENAPGVFWLAKPDWAEIDLLSKGYERITHHSSQAVLDGENDFFSCIHPDDKDEVRRVFSAVSSEPEILKYRIVRPDGGIRWMRSINFATYDINGNLRNIAGIGEDITESRLNDQRLKLAASVYDNTAEAIVVTDAQNKILSVNPAFTRITGYGLPDVEGKNPSVLSSGRQTKHFYQEMWLTLKQYGRWQGEVWNRRLDGELYVEWLSITALKGDSGDIENYVAVFTDITDRKEKEELIQYQANYDALTGIPNRGLFHDRLKQAIVSVDRQRTRGAVMFIDLDHFKEVNDTLGHEAGDDLLKEVANRLQKATRATDTIARLGGDEFTVIIPHFNHIDDIAGVAIKVIDSLSRVYNLGHNSAHISASIGITVFPDDGSEIKRILQNADQAMYAAKSAGRRTYRYFTSEMQAEAEERQNLQNDMRNAINRREFTVYYQPIVDSNGRLVKFEALVRWIHPDKGLIPPDRFIPLAEETGLILPLGWWVFQEAVTQLALWQKDHPQLCMAVNLSSKQIATDERHVENFITILQALDVTANSVTIEVTESLFLDPTGDSVKKLERLRDQGFRIAIDDFGTGYSSLSYLKKLPLSIIKIDKTFVSDLDKDNGDRVLVDAILSIADSMALEVVAEGVETEQQAAYLRDKGANMHQGWLYSKPLPADDAHSWLSENLNV